MLFKIQKPTFFKLYRYYLRKLRNTALYILVINGIGFLLNLYSTWNTGISGLGGALAFGMEGSSVSHYKIFLLVSFMLTVSYFGLLGFLFASTRQLNGKTGSFLRSKHSHAEETSILLFSYPINRQTLVAAKLATYATYWMGINLVGLTLPTCLVLALNTQLSFLAILSFFLLAGFLFSLANFFWLALPSLYVGVASGKKIFITWIYLIGSFIIHPLVYMLAPWWVSLPLFLVGIIAGVYFTQQYWENFQHVDLI